MKAACLQMRSGRDQARNVADFRDLARQAASAGATYIQSPEMTGLVDRDRQAMLANAGSDARQPVFAAAAELARDLRAWIHVGSTAVALGDGKAANRAALFSPAGDRVVSYDKIHMFDVDLAGGESWRESIAYAPGDRAVVADMDGARIGLGICYDLRFPELFRQQALHGAQVLTTPACFTRQTGEAHWHVLLRARAIENGAFVISAAQGGRHEDGRETYGHSLAVDPWGRVIGELPHDEPGVLVFEFDPAMSGECRSRIPNLRNARPFTLEMAHGEPTRERGAA
jgi:predicted amidohydrolase